jgi:hypothetical protein
MIRKGTVMKKLALILIVLAMSLPAWSEILVFQLTMKMTTGEVSDDDGATWALSTATSKAWAVIDVNFVISELLNPDVNFVSQPIIPFGTNASRAKVYVDNAVMKVFFFTVDPGVVIKGKAKPDIMVLDFTAENILTQRAGVGIDGRLQGAAKLTAVNPSILSPVASSMKGVCFFDSLDTFPYTVEGSGTVAAAFNKPLTLMANATPMTADEVAELIKTNTLAAYAPVTQTP